MIFRPLPWPLEMTNIAGLGVIFTVKICQQRHRNICGGVGRMERDFFIQAWDSLGYLVF